MAGSIRTHGGVTRNKRRPDIADIKQWRTSDQPFQRNAAN
jgi:hypothetical protein